MDQRCGWAGPEQIYVDYHDTEWGVPEYDSRHRGKISATISNARAWQRIESAQGFDKFLWDYVDGTPLRTVLADRSAMPTFSPLSMQISKDLKKAGFKFCGPTIVYAFMEATGLINNHTTDCPRHKTVAAMARSPAI